MTNRRDDRADPVCYSRAMQSLLERARRAALVTSNVLITGESGVGKDLLARYIHQQGARASGPFVPVNCASMPDALVDSELFGYRRGAFTGAADDRRGLVEEADRGVLFLDEIGDMPLSAQVRLLRFFDSGEVRRMGDTTIRHVDVKTIAATNRRLEEEIADGRFRSDLFYRLSVVRLEVPPLRDRREDIPLLVQRLLRNKAEKLGRLIRSVSPAALSALVQYHWPGNIRELQNAIESAIIATEGDIVELDALPLLPGLLSHDREPSPRTGHHRINAVLERHGGHRSNAAAALGISRTTLWRRMRHHRTDAVRFAEGK